MTQALPARPNLDWLKRTAKERLAELRTNDPISKLHAAQFLVARDYGFKSWRELKARVDELASSHRENVQVFEAARTGDVEAVRRAVASGFDPATPDAGGHTIYQIAKERGHGAIEVLVRDLRETVADDKGGKPIFSRWSPYDASSRSLGASPMRETESPAVQQVPDTPERIQEPTA
jgi:hypothetical protein